MIRSNVPSACGVSFYVLLGTGSAFLKPELVERGRVVASRGGEVQGPAGCDSCSDLCSLWVPVYHKPLRILFIIRVSGYILEGGPRDQESPIAAEAEINHSETQYFAMIPVARAIPRAPTAQQKKNDTTIFSSMLSSNPYQPTHHHPIMPRLHGITPTKALVSIKRI
ncbi:hypothetical protein BDZ94DRAFT_592462 [Collybia nuda]|uniref:Uncharacterized protein n=1 Tax=Collybia nuda TaxID=64659 RepID=A0A9P5Y5F2_9AGAR|nr:hypothetical protein BDZ94DRAFT_592462 [Collybia nuda]